MTSSTVRPNAAAFILILALAFAGLTGCTVLEPKPDLAQFYVLRSSSRAPASAASAKDGAPELRVGPGIIAAYLEATPIAVLAGPNRLKYLESHRWAESLSRGISRTLGEEIARRLGAPQITSYPDPLPGATGYDLRFEINRFEGDLDGAVTLEVAWQLVHMPSVRVMFRTRSTYEIPAAGAGRDVAAYVERMSVALGRWADDIVAAVNSITPEPESAGESG